jgi:hypothetical protein
VESIEAGREAAPRVPTSGGVVREWVARRSIATKPQRAEDSAARRGGGARDKRRQVQGRAAVAHAGIGTRGAASLPQFVPSPA